MTVLAAKPAFEAEESRCTDRRIGTTGCSRSGTAACNARDRERWMHNPVHHAWLEAYLRALPYAFTAMPEDADKAFPLLGKAIELEPEPGKRAGSFSPINRL
jgi:hypothetical protein